MPQDRSRSRDRTPPRRRRRSSSGSFERRRNRKSRTPPRRKSPTPDRNDAKRGERWGSPTPDRQKEEKKDSGGSGFIFAIPQRAGQPGSKADREKASESSRIEEPTELEPLKYLGLVKWLQSNGTTQDTQDQTMHKIALREYGEGARALFWKEYVEKKAEGLPEKNTDEKLWLCFAGTGSVGKGGPLSKLAVEPDCPLDGTSSNPYATLGDRLAIAVRPKRLPSPPPGWKEEKAKAETPPPDLTPERNESDSKSPAAPEGGGGSWGGGGSSGGNWGGSGG
eukprot:Hpha_TRINITY_DN4957_c0_g2::TRINITY_DN4957_c0_g2_i1::g.51423::m.51423